MKFGKALKAMRKGHTVGMMANHGQYYRIFNGDIHAINSEGKFLFKPTFAGWQLLSEGWTIEREGPYAK